MNRVAKGGPNIPPARRGLKHYRIQLLDLWHRYFVSHIDWQSTRWVRMGKIANLKPNSGVVCTHTQRRFHNFSTSNIKLYHNNYDANTIWRHSQILEKCRYTHRRTHPRHILPAFLLPFHLSATEPSGWIYTVTSTRYRAEDTRHFIPHRVGGHRKLKTEEWKAPLLDENHSKQSQTSGYR